MKSISLAQLHIKEPCHADWDAMNDLPGDSSKRYCGQCQKHVHNLDALTQPEIDALFEQHQGKLCIRYTPPSSASPTSPVPLAVSPAITWDSHLPAKPSSPFPRLLKTLSRTAAALLLATTLTLTGCGSSSTSYSTSRTPVERFNDWRYSNAPDWFNFMLDPIFGHAATPVAMGISAMPVAGGVALMPTPPPTPPPTPTTQPTLEKLGEAIAPPVPAPSSDACIKGEVTIKMGKPATPPATQPTVKAP